MKRPFLLLLALLLATAPFAQRTSPDAAAQLDRLHDVQLFRGVDGTYFDLENDRDAHSAGTYLNILEWLRGRVPGLQLHRVRGVPVPYLRNAPVSIFVDEILMDASVLQAIPVSDMALVKVMRTPLGTAVRTLPGGAIAIYTKGGEEDEEEPDAR